MKILRDFKREDAQTIAGRIRSGEEKKSRCPRYCNGFFGEDGGKYE